MLKAKVDLKAAQKIVNYMPKIVKTTLQTEHFPKALEIGTKNKLTIHKALFKTLTMNTNSPPANVRQGASKSN